jgi:carboxymethylenebutenolidase
MCYDPAARPPAPPIAGGAGATTRRLILQARDGNRFSAFSALTDRADAPGIVVMPDVRGLHPFYEDLAARFAEAGVNAVAMDYFGRTAGTGPRDEDFDHRPHVEQTTPEAIAADVAAAAAFLRSPEGGGASSVFTVGFCFGGRNSLNQAGEGHGLAGVVGFYGGMRPRHPGDRHTPIHRATTYAAPVLALFGGADSSIPKEKIEEFRRALESGGVEHEIVVYEDAPHSFFDRAFERYRDECDDAWRRVLAFIRPNP